ncbi:heat-inducible transcription repressor HrcA [Salinicoccus hispanicus]|uniref:Heat-inducible transcription repressor HrcA n=1 Tax=Salinicoccus hispanicus TaxID=157225 RepID=A0A6N8TWL2_9STAP|nr:heat-inducible transcription repressor HrcA [Salinicoccus hispanicus]MXQ50080.1 heat-inducible transcription repressor HrcA [Salinicoccus hispanicus]
MSILTQRQEIILFSIVDDFLKVMMPISSKHLIEKYRLDISSATVRNEMAKLETDGYLTKPHTSAGRIPSRKALRFYTGMLSEELGGSKSQLNFDFHPEVEEMDRGGMTRSLADVISSTTQYLTQVSLTEEDEIIKGLFLTPITTNTLLLIIVLESGTIRKIPVDSDDFVTVPELEKLGNEMNVLSYGQPLSSLPSIIDQMQVAPHLSVLKASIRRSVVGGISEPQKVIGHSGFNHLIHQISSDISTLQLLYDDMESDQLNDIIDLNTIDGVDVYFSDELNRDYDSISVIATNFSFNGMNGNLMIIGPEMMGYKEVIRLMYAIRNQEMKRSEHSDGK